MRLGIDFGTTRTVVCAAVDGRYPLANYEINGMLYDHVPGLVAYHEGNLHFGAEAFEGHPTKLRLIRSLKREVSFNLPDEAIPGLGPEAGTALEVTTGFLKYLNFLLRNHSNLDIGADEPLEACIAVPANASTRQRYLTLEAFSQAGFNVVGMLNEPTAAAIEFAHRNRPALGSRSPKRYVIVYDLGGGTFDTSAVSLMGSRFELLATEGIPRLGGDDFDLVIANHVLQTLKPNEQHLSLTTLAHILELCREAKESIGPKTKKILLDLSRIWPERESLVIPTSEIYEECQPLLDRTTHKVQQLFERLPSFGIDPENTRELGGVYLVGGGISLPMVAKKLRELYPRKVKQCPQPNAATAIGLAIAADPDAEIIVREATTRHLGVWREADNGQEKIFDPIIAKNEATDQRGEVIATRTYRPKHSIGRLRFLECPSLDAEGQPLGDLTPWRQVVFPYDPALSLQDDLESISNEKREDLQDQEIAETYTYRSDGTVTVNIQNQTSGYERQYLLGELS